MSAPVLELRDVRKRFRRSRRSRDEVVAVDGVSLALAPGEILAVVGGSGAGKSTVGRLVLGLERADDGAVCVEGTDLGGLSRRALRRVRRRMHLILQDPYESLHPGMRIGAAVGEPLLIARVGAEERRERVQAALEEVGLAPAGTYLERYPHQLSGGQRQRVAIARALVLRPALVVADEPTSMLDASVRAGILELVTRIRAVHGTAFLFITHDLAMARYVSDRIAVMAQGRVVELGETEQVINQPQHPYTKTLLDASESVR